MILLTGLVLSSLKYGDNDCILHCFTKEKGFQSFFVRGIYSKKSKKKAYLLPFTELCFTVTKKQKGGSMLTAAKIELVDSRDFYENVKANLAVFFVADFLNQILRHENENPKMYDEILLFLNELEAAHHQSYLVFLIKMLKNSGVLPLANQEKFLDPESGNFIAEQRHPLFGEDISGLWNAIIGNDNPYQIRITGPLKKEFLDSILVYCHYHVADFRTPGSLEIVKQIFV